MNAVARRLRAAGHVLALLCLVESQPTWPSWQATVPHPSAPLGGLAPIPTAEHHVVHEGTPALGTYNHGAQVFVHESSQTVLVCWKSGAKDEDAPGQRIFLAYGRVADSGTNGSSLQRNISPPLVLFPNVSAVTGFYLPGTVVNGGEIRAAPGSGRLIATAKLANNTKQDETSGGLRSPDVHLGTGHKQYPIAVPLVRQVFISAAGIPSFGPIYWDGLAPPAGFDFLHYPCRKQMPASMLADLQALTTHGTNDPFDAAVPPAQRSEFFLTEHTSYLTPDGTRQVLLARDDSPAFDNGSVPEGGNSWHFYGTTRSLEANGKTWGSWLPVKRTTIPDSQSNMAAGLLPLHIGAKPAAVFLIHNAVPRPCNDRNTTAWLQHHEILGCPRDPLALSIATDGLQFTKVFALIGDRPRMRYLGMCKNPGFMSLLQSICVASVFVSVYVYTIMYGCGYVLHVYCLEQVPTDCCCGWAVVGGLLHQQGRYRLERSAG